MRTPVAVPAGAFLGEYCGELIDLAEAQRRVRTVYKDTTNYYFLDYDAAAGEVLDAGLRGTKTRFVNHSVRRRLTQCDPNCYMEKWLLSGAEADRNAEFQVGLFALRDIAANEELTFNYGACRHSHRLGRVPVADTRRGAGRAGAVLVRRA